MLRGIVILSKNDNNNIKNHPNLLTQKHKYKAKINCRLNMRRSLNKWRGGEYRGKEKGESLWTE